MDIKSETVTARDYARIHGAKENDVSRWARDGLIKACKVRGAWRIPIDQSPPDFNVLFPQIESPRDEYQQDKSCPIRWMRRQQRIQDHIFRIERDIQAGLDKIPPQPLSSLSED